MHRDAARQARRARLRASKQGPHTLEANSALDEAELRVLLCWGILFLIN